jgi:hypothetical protein
MIASTLSATRAGGIDLQFRPVEFEIAEAGMSSLALPFSAMSLRVTDFFTVR